MKKLLIIQHVDREGPSYIRQYADEHGMAVDVIPIWKPYVMPDVAAYDGFVILGGPMGAYEEFPSKADEMREIGSALEKNVPTLGLCLGAQLIAAALGARVYPGPKEIGHYEVELTPQGEESPLFRGLDFPLTVLQWHGDTFDIPAGATHTARSVLVPHQAFSYGSAHGLQFHVEIPPERLHAIAHADRSWANEDFSLDEEKLHREADALASQMKAQCWRLMDNFFAI